MENKIERRKWQEYYDLPEIQRIRALIKDTYSNKLEFIEESHQYFLDGVEYDCVSNITHRFKETTQEQMAERCARTKEEILAQWKKVSGEACEFGTSVHEFGESMFYYMVGEDENILESCRDRFTTGVPMPQNKFEEAICKFWEDLPESIVPVLAETKVFNTTGTPYAGTFDILFYYVEYPGSPKNGLLIFDYKTNGATAEPDKAYGKLTENFNGTRLLFPFNDLLDCSESFYKLQLACYQIPIENLGLKVIGRRIIWVHPNGTYEKIGEPDLADRVREALNIRSWEEIYKEQFKIQ